MKRGVTCFMFAGCRHADAISAAMLVVENEARPEVEARWDAQAEKLFGEYTARWTDTERTAFRARIWPTPPPVVPQVLRERESIMRRSRQVEASRPAFRHSVEPREDEPAF